MADEKLCWQWNDFRENISSAFGDLRHDQEFTDVTLASEDGEQVKAHKVVLVASSPFFLNILKRNKHPYPLVYMRGVRSENLMAMVDFFYHGEANVHQGNLDSFLVLAEELQLKGLRGNQTDREEEKDVSEEQEATQRLQQRSHNSRSASKKNILSKNVSPENELVVARESEKALALVNDKTNTTDIQSLDQLVKSMMTFSENAGPWQGKARQGKARICKVCGKEGSMMNIMSHIEGNHITGISIPCEHCGKLFKSRNGLSCHKYYLHRNE